MSIAEEIVRDLAASNPCQPVVDETGDKTDEVQCSLCGTVMNEHKCVTEYHTVDCPWRRAVEHERARR